MGSNPTPSASKRKLHWDWTMGKDGSTMLIVTFPHLKLTMFLKRRPWVKRWVMTTKTENREANDWDFGGGALSLRRACRYMREVYGEALARRFAGVDDV